MSEKRFTPEHEWALVDGAVATVGITDYAQGALGDIVFVELPTVGRTLTKGENAAVVESVKAASDVYAPFSGMVTETNPALLEDSGLLNRDAEGAGWMFRMTIAAPAEVATLLDVAAYAAHLKALG